MFLKHATKDIVAITVSMGICACTTIFAGDLNPDYPTTISKPAFYICSEIGYQLINAQLSDNFNIRVFPLGTLQPEISTDINTSEGFMGRVAIGYLFHYFGLEAGFSAYNPSQRIFQGLSVYQPAAIVSFSQVKTKTNLYGADLLGRLTLPFQSFYSFLAAGVAYIHLQYPALVTTLHVAGSSPAPLTLWQGNTTGFVRPKVVIGIGYNFSNHWAIDASYFYIMGEGKVTSPSYLPDLTASTAGLIYKF